MSELENLQQTIRDLEEERKSIHEKASSGIIGFIKTRVFSAPYLKLKKRYKRALVDLYMHQYHPACFYEFKLASNDGSDIVRKSGLMSFDECDEEDVIKGIMYDIPFYISEIDLIDIHRSTDKDGMTKKKRVTKFSGILFSFATEELIFPRSKITTKQGAFSRFFTRYTNHEEYDISYITNDEIAFHETLDRLFPFIEYLQKNQGSVMVSTDHKEISILFSSNMRFLDQDVPKLKESFLEGSYYKSMVKQFNSLFFILESFAQELNILDMDETLSHRLASIDESDLFRF